MDHFPTNYGLNRIEATNQAVTVVAKDLGRSIHNTHEHAFVLVMNLLRGMHTSIRLQLLNDIHTLNVFAQHIPVLGKISTDGSS